MMWNNDVVANPNNILWLAENSDNRWLLVMSNLPLASEAIIQLVKCGCMKQCASNPCLCCRNGTLSCPDDQLGVRQLMNVKE